MSAFVCLGWDRVEHYQRTTHKEVSVDLPSHTWTPKKILHFLTEAQSTIMQYHNKNSRVNFMRKLRPTSCRSQHSGKNNLFYSLCYKNEWYSRNNLCKVLLFPQFIVNLQKSLDQNSTEKLLPVDVCVDSYTLRDILPFFMWRLFSFPVCFAPCNM